MSDWRNTEIASPKNRSSIPEEKHRLHRRRELRNPLPLSQILFGSVFCPLIVVASSSFHPSLRWHNSYSFTVWNNVETYLVLCFAVFGCICHLCFNDLICSTIEQEIVEFPLLHSNACPVLPTSLLPFCTKTTILSSHSPPPHYSLLTTNFRQNSFTSHNKIDFPFPLFLSHFANDIYHTVIGNPIREIDFMPQQHRRLNNLKYNHWLNTPSYTIIT